MLKKSKWIILLYSFFMSGILCFAGCREEDTSSQTIMQIYCISNEETRVESHDYIMEATTEEEQLKELLVGMSTLPEKLTYKVPLSMGFELLSYELIDGKLLLTVDEKYKEMSVTTETLVRAALVRTLTQLPTVNFVKITINGNPLYDSLNNMIGWMAADYFISNEGNEINTYEKVRLKLYFANEDGDALVAVNTAELAYNSNISLEKLVVEELIKGPDTDKVYATINPDTKVISVMVKDSICYVNLDENFLIQTNNVTAEVTLYSIVNSLAEISNVNKVQIFINGDGSGTYRDGYSFNTLFERNLDIITSNEK
ncbi:GerMN domain-containing protein [Lachnospiraceae bacterium OttesenSCG-928-D06]|nr:GerMN domain-containing protein [Lachnospiraceae bacterium OttesenSCG-928-D06]